MYQVQQADFGYVLTLAGTVEATEMKRWYEATRNHLQGMKRAFGVLVDARRCHPLSKVARFWLLRGQSACEDAGLERAAVLVDTTQQEEDWSRLLAATTPTRRVRFIDAADYYPRVRALSWILGGVEPHLYEGNATTTPVERMPELDDGLIVEATRS